jgi:hypothetical protein
MSRIHRGDQAFDYDSLLGTETEMPFSGRAASCAGD